MEEKTKDKQSEPNYYAIIPSEIRYCKEITANAKLLYGEITALCNKEGYCWASNDYFAKLYKVKKETISVWIRSLKENNFIRYEIENDYKRKIYLEGVCEKSQGGMRKIARGVCEKSQHNNTVNIKKNSIYKKNFFFDLPSNQRRLYMEDKLSRCLEKQENTQLEEFCSYWTEANSDGGKQKWQFEKTFDVIRRFRTWLANSKNWGSNKNFKKGQSSYSPNKTNKPTSAKYAKFITTVKV